MRISDWSSDVCSSDLYRHRAQRQEPVQRGRCVQESPAILQIIKRDEHLRGGQPARAKQVGIAAGKQYLPGGSGGLRVFQICPAAFRQPQRSEEHTSELQSLMRISYAVFCLKKKKN